MTIVYRKTILIDMIKSMIFILIFFVLINTGCAQNKAYTKNQSEVNKEVDLALERLYAESPKALEFSRQSEGILVFPDVVRFGLGIGGHYGRGAMVIEGKIAGYYKTAGALYGATVGTQSFGYAMFLMTDEALRYLQESGGWEFGVGLNIVFVDKGAAGGLSTITERGDVYVFIFGQKGIMLDLGHLQGTKITKTSPDSK